jgi:sn-glycerol 3-phosphate transport system ATP-binding protein/multiple sugar transport system ATP-binding protein
VADLTLAGIRKQFGKTPVLRGIDLHAADGQLMVLVGPSGCGKSTLLRTIAGLEQVDEGRIQIGERDVTRAPPKDRDVAMVFQSYALYPHLTVAKNLAFGLELRKTARATIDARVEEVAGLLGLGELLGRYPRELSGGQRQRVAMGRAIARRPSLFLFDEPLSNLDAALRAEVRVEIKRLHQELAATMVYVTHDQVEAMTLADVLVVLNGGVVEQVGAPLDIYERPRTRFVAGFMGSPAMNFLEVDVEDGRARAKGVDLPLGLRVSGAQSLGIRPHDVRLAESEDRSDRAALELEVRVVEAMGFETYAHGTVGGQAFVARLEGEQRPKAGETLRLHADPAALHCFDPETGLRHDGNDSGSAAGSEQE